jgi:hypothetical protein
VEIARLNSRIIDCTENWTTAFYPRRADLSLPVNGTGTPPKRLTMLRVTVQPDKINDYIALKKEYLNAVKKSGVKLQAVWRGQFGTSQWEFVTIEGLDNWAELDGPDPVTKAIGAEAASKFNFSTMQSQRQYDVIRYRSELSYVPNAAN